MQQEERQAFYVTSFMCIYICFVNVDNLIGLTPIELCPSSLEPTDDLSLSLSLLRLNSCHYEVQSLHNVVHKLLPLSYLR